MTHPTDDEIMELAGAWFHTGENQKRDDGYYYRSLGTPSNVRGSDLIEFARALLAEQAKDAAEDAELLERAFVALDNYRAAIHYAQDKAALMSAIKVADYEAGLVMSAIRAARAAERKA